MGELLSFGEVRRGWLGVGIELVTVEIAQQVKGKVGKGVWVNSVFEGDPAHRAGIRIGDVILKPDTSTMRLVPWYKEPTAQIIHDAFYFDGVAVDVSPREVLKRVIKLFDDSGLRPMVAPELEFFFR